jgi:long-chain acyl-CoA synthetase
VFGQVACVLAPPLLGAEVVLPEDLQARELAYRSRRHRVSFVVGVPRQLELLREHVLREAERRGQARDLARLVEASAARGFIRRRFASRRWRRLVGRRLLGFACGGAALPGPVEEFWRRLGFVVMQGYGMTETAALVSLQNPLASKPGSIGKPLPGQEVKVGAGGEILVRGASVAAGYWDGGLRPLTDAEGWLATGDLAERDPEGHLFFRGRSKDMIVTAAGLNVYPADLEAALDAQPEVKASAVVPFEGPAGPEPVAVVILEAGEGDPEARARASLERANARLAQHQRMRRVVIWPESDFPRTGGLRKVKKSEVEAALAAREKAAPGEAGPIRGELQRVLRSVGADPEAASEARAALLADLKLDSLGQVELVSALEERFGVELDEAAVTPATTVEDLERLVAGGTAPAPAYPYPAWAQWPPWTTLRRVLQAALVVPLTRLLGSPSIAGRERLRGLEGPALFICNHVTMVDPALVLVALPRGVRLAVAMEGERLRGYRRPPAGARPGAFLGPLVYALLVLLFNTFPLPRRSGFRRSLQFASERVEEGQSLLIFPEGRRTPDGALHRFFPGTGLLAARLGLPVVPLRILGLFEVRRRRPPFARPGEVKVVVGEPVRYGAEDTAEAIASDLERRVGELG